MLQPITVHQVHLQMLGEFKGVASFVDTGKKRQRGAQPAASEYLFCNRKFEQKKFCSAIDQELQEKK
jgi:hypothetical protein